MSATTQQFFLRWNNYVNHLTYAFDSLRTQEDLVDVTLSCEGRKIRAHKVILSACSTYFREVFQENPCQHPVIVFKNVRFEDLSSIIEFIYQGEVNVVQESLPSFLHTAELLSVQGLTEGSTDKEGRDTPVPTPVSKQFSVASATKAQTSGIVTRMVTGSGQATVREIVRLPPKSTTLSTVTTETAQPKRKRFYIDSDDNIAIEGINFVKQSPDTITIENANVEFTPMKIDIPEYIDISTTADESTNAGEEVLLEERTDDAGASADDEAGDSQDQDITDGDSKPQILAVRSVSEGDMEQSYTVQEVDSGDLHTSEYTDQSKYSADNQGKADDKGLQQDAQLRFRCSICWKGFKHPMSLTLHRDLHSGKTKCPVCKRSFSRSYDMRTHLNKIHKITLNFDAKLNIHKF
ncbi:transcription factor GAGA isoform X3 [Phlebotomus argentipes]|uniref:transcription factor GAGA isoform X3 n=1 Tax=Phlebotomus argentipes TaxID=94469 RepID=UPI00289329C8|nr:transcription factor GAGA isoform X3 [Phlebotomus argentipes]